MIRTFLTRSLLMLLVFAVVSSSVEPVRTPVSAARTTEDPPPAGRPMPDAKYPPWDGQTGMGEAIAFYSRKLVVDIAQYTEETEVREAATAALAAGTQAAIDVFLDTGEQEAQARAKVRRDETARQDRQTILALAGTGGPIFNAEVDRVLAGSDYDRAFFLAYGKDIAKDRDERARQATQARADELRARVTVLAGGAAGDEVKKAAQEALAGGDAAIEAFLNSGYLAAAKRDADAREAYLKELEERNKAAEQASELAQKARRASEARKNLLIAHGHGVRALQRAANAMISGATAARQAAQILAANTAGGHHSPESFSLVRQEAARQYDLADHAATEAKNASVAATTEATILKDLGLTYGEDWSRIALGMAEASKAATLAIETSQHAITATMATDAAVGDEAQARARAEQARQWLLNAQQNEAGAARLAAAAEAQANAAKDALAEANQAYERAKQARDEASNGLDRTREYQRTAETERDKARECRRTAETERDNAERHRRDAEREAADARKARGEAERQGRLAAAARQRAETQEGIARTADETATREAGNAARARQNAWDAKARGDGLEARAQALLAAAAAAHGTEQEAPAKEAARLARIDADEAASAAKEAQDAANRATGAAARAREAATQATYSAAAARAAAEQAAQHAANADVAASNAEQSAAGVHVAATKANAA
ncbi:hypothetical protein ACFSYJ_03300, partial [Amycolatopsis samaneae]